MEGGGSSEERTHSWPDLELMFQFSERIKDSFCFKCLLCLPKTNHITAYKNLPSNLRKHIEVEVEEKLKAQIDLISAHLDHVETQLDKERSTDRAKQTESKINTRIQAMKNSFQAELEQMRREYQAGFQSVHDAIASLRHIGDTKAKLDKGELKKDIRHIRRMMEGQPDA